MGCSRDHLDPRRTHRTAAGNRGRLVWTRVHREFFRDQPEVYDFRKPGTILMSEYADFIEKKSHKLMSAGKLDDVRDSLS